MLYFLLYLGAAGIAVALYHLALGFFRVAMWLGYVVVVISGVVILLAAVTGCAPARNDDAYWSRMTPAISNVLDRR